MRNVYVRADRVMPRVKHGKDQVPARPLHEQDHLGSGENAGAVYAQKLDCIVVAHLKNVFASRANLIVGHRFWRRFSHGWKALALVLLITDRRAADIFDVEAAQGG